MMQDLLVVQLTTYQDYYVKTLFDGNVTKFNSCYNKILQGKNATLNECLQLCADLLCQFFFKFLHLKYEIQLINNICIYFQFQIKIRNVKCFHEDAVCEYFPASIERLKDSSEVVDFLDKVQLDKKGDFSDEEENSFYEETMKSLMKLLDSKPSNPKRTLWVICDLCEIFQVNPPQRVYDSELKFLREQLKVETHNSEVKVIALYCHKFFDRVGDDVVSYDQKKRLESRLNEFGFERLDIIGDGNCLFRSVSHEVFDDEEYHVVMRILVAAMFTEYSDHYESNRPSTKKTEGAHPNDCEESWSEYRHRLSRVGEPANFHCIQAVADMFCLKVILITSHDKFVVREFYPYDKETYNGTIFLCAYDQHMEVLRRKG